MAQQLIAQQNVANNLKVVADQHTTVAASDNITIPSLTKILAAVVSLNEDAADGLSWATCTFTGNVLTIKTWQNTSGTDPTPTATVAFGKKVGYVVVGY